MSIDAVVAGAGIWGCTVARRLAEAGRKVLVIEKRAAVGGNSRCEIDPETGIEVHLYGSHILHTSIPEVWEFINRFTRLNGYQHHGMTTYKGKTYHLPIGLSLINSFFGVNLRPGEVKEFMADEAHSKAVFDAFFRGYTSKQWGRPPEEVDESVIKRIPVRDNYDVNYYNDYNQGIPVDGYAEFFRKMLDHPNIEVRCNCGLTLACGMFFAGEDELPDVPIYYSGPVDELFGYRFGRLPWRSLRFETERLDVKDFQGCSMLNYPDVSVPYTRIHEFKHFHPENKAVMSLDKTIITREYPLACGSSDDPYYPIENKESRELFDRYVGAAAEFGNLVLGGRLGLYRYFDMDKSRANALMVRIA